MRLSPLDIQHMEFERGVSGYRPAQVRAFLERIASEREDLLKEVQALRERLEHQAARIEELQQAESDLRQAVIAAERVGNQIKESARTEATLIKREAEADLRDAKTELARLRSLQDSFREQFRGMLHAFERSLDARAGRIGDEDLADQDASDVLLDEESAARATGAPGRHGPDDGSG